MGKQELKDTKAGAAPTSAPELTDEEKRRIEAELTVPNVPSTDASSTDSPEGDEETDDEADSKIGKANGTINSAKDTEADKLTPDVDPDQAKPHGHRLKRFFAGYWHRKKWTLPLTLLVIVGILAAVPYTRYPIAGLVLKHRATITVVDASTKKPVSSAAVDIDGQTYKTDKNGKVTVDALKVGKHTLAVSKKYYKEGSSELFVPLLKDTQREVSIQATGRQVSIVVVNKITKAPIEDVILKAAGTEVKTDKDGKAVIVLPADKADLPITITGNGYNQQETKVKVTDAVVPENTFAMVPAGKLYFLSRQSGKIDVAKTDLDGGNRQTVVYGTGKEDDKNTVLLASRDWKYLALLSRRDSGLPKIYLIDTSTDKMTVIDEGDASFNLSGWSGHNFVFNIQRNNVQFFDANRQAVKKYDADKRQLITVDQTTSEKATPTTTQYQQYSNFYLVADKLIYTTQWFYVNNGASYGGTVSQADRSNVVRSVSVADGAKKDVKTFPSNQYTSFTARLYEPGGLYISAYSASESKNVYFKYEDGKVESTSIANDNDFYSTVYPTYLTSPDGNKTFWSEQRDGLDTFFIGDAEGKNGKQVGVWDDYKVYGWYTDAYLLVTKNNSALYAVSVAGGEPVKVSDYHKPQLTYEGYGGGYGGL